MKLRLSIFLALLCINIHAFSQVDSLFHSVKVNNYKILPDSLLKGDSVLIQEKGRIESMLEDLNFDIAKINAYNLGDANILELDSLYINAEHKIESLKLIFEKDSISAPFVSRIDSLISERRAVLDSINQSIGLSSPNFSLPESFGTSIPELPKFKVESIENIDLNPLEIPSLQLSGLPEIPSLNIPTQNLNVPALDKIQTYSNQLESVNANLAKLKEGEYKEMMEAEVQKQALKIDELSVVNDQNQALENIKNQHNSVEEALKQPDVLSQVKVEQKYVDHFADKKDKVKNDLDEFAKEQLKYRDIADARFLPKRPPNEMKSKPWYERIIPGITIQVFQAENVSLDMAPFMGYRFTGWLSAGISGYKRITYLKEYERIKIEKLVGFRGYTDIRIINGFTGHLEVEYLVDHTTVQNSHGSRPSVFSLYENQSSAWKLNLGVQQRYGIGKGFYGHFLIMYDLLQLEEFPHNTGSSVRFGVDYQIRKKVKKS